MQAAADLLSSDSHLLPRLVKAQPRLVGKDPIRRVGISLASLHPLLVYTYTTPHRNTPPPADANRLAGREPEARRELLL
eukprot:241488-Chlamydomonas_euryale.AAC.1